MAEAVLKFTVECTKLANFGSYLRALDFKYDNVRVEYEKDSGLFFEDYRIRITGDEEDLKIVRRQIQSDRERYVNN